MCWNWDDSDFAVFAMLAYHRRGRCWMTRYCRRIENGRVMP